MDYRDLAFLASGSAVAIEIYLNGDKSENHFSQNVEKLSEEVGRLSKRDGYDFGNILMLAEIIWPNRKDWKDGAVDGVYLQANLLAKELRCFNELSRERQIELRDVCLKVSNLASRNCRRDYYGLVA